MKKLKCFYLAVIQNLCTFSGQGHQTQNATLTTIFVEKILLKHSAPCCFFYICGKSPMSLTPPVSDADHISGNLESRLELVEYGDFECPHCGRAYPLVKRIQEELHEQVKFIFRNFPLTKVHPHAKLAAIAAEAAAQQGKFWEMHSVLFEHQRNLTHRAIIDYAATMGLDAKLFEAALENEDLSKKVDKQFMSGLRSGVNQTPSFFINGERYTHSWEGDQLYRYLVGLIGG